MTPTIPRLIPLAPALAALMTTATPAQAAKSGVTFSGDIAPIIHQRCAQCHRPGEAAPFSLIDYDDVRKRSKTIQRVIGDRYMPPWHPVPGHGEFQHERRLSEDEIALFNAWIENGKAEGDPAIAPEPPVFPEGWQLGEPDLVVTMEKTYDVPAEGADIYRNFVLPIDLPEDRWVTAIELRPEARPVVHHVLYFLDDSGTARKLDGRDGQPGFRGMGFRVSGRLGGYVPGAMPQHFPQGLALPLPAGSDLVLQTHFHPVGKAETEQFTVGLYFADQAPEKSLLSVQVPPGFGRGMNIDIPPGEKDYRIEDAFTLPIDIDAHSIGGHAHYLCREMKMTATLPDGTAKPLLYIDDWDLNWQDRYNFKEPVRLPAGTILKTELIYDNSADNPDNPTLPPVRVKWGRESTDEMGSITLQVTAVDESERGKLNTANKGAQARLAGELFGQGAAKLLLAYLPRAVNGLDKNQDGRLQDTEMPPRMKDRLLQKLDLDKNLELDESELQLLYDWAKAQKEKQKPSA